MKKIISILLILCAAISLSAQTVEDLRIAANRGDAEAQCVLGIFYYVGHEVSQDNTEAAKWFHKSAEKDYAPAQVFLGAFYYGGVGVEKNDATALYWCEKAYKNWGTVSKETQKMLAQQGFDESFLEKTINELKSSVSNAGKNSNSAARPAAASTQAQIDEYLKKASASTNSSYWYEKAAELGDEKSQTVIAIFYECGQGVPMDGNTALYWYEKCLNNENFSGNRESILKSVRELKSQGYTATRTKRVGSTPPPSAPASAPAPAFATSGKIEKVWLEHNVYNNGEKGMNIHVHFTVNGMKGIAGTFKFFVYDSNGKEIKIGNRTSTNMFTPAYDNSEYKDVVCFQSYSGFNLFPRGTSELKLNVWLFQLGHDSKILDESDYVYFSHTR